MLAVTGPPARTSGRVGGSDGTHGDARAESSWPFVPHAGTGSLQILFGALASCRDRE